MRRILLLLVTVMCVFAACDKPSRVAQYRAEKHRRDSVSLMQQTQSLTYYQAQLEELLPVADSLLPLFSYEKNSRFQDHGYYVSERITANGERVRILVRDDGKDPILVYKSGKRLATPSTSLKEKELESLDRAQHLQIVISDIRECEKRIARTSKEINKYEKRLQKQ